MKLLAPLLVGLLGLAWASGSLEFAANLPMPGTLRADTSPACVQAARQMESSFSARMRVTDQRCYVLTRPPAWDSYGLRQYIEGMLRDRGWKMLEKKMAYNAVLLELWQAPDGGLLGMALSEAGGSSVNLMTVRLSR